MTKGTKKVQLTEDKLVSIIEGITKKAISEAKVKWVADQKKLTETKQPKITSKQIDRLVETKVNAILTARFGK